MAAVEQQAFAPLAAPFPWFGGKSRVASIVWERFGNVPNYCEPFMGSLAVLLRRPHAPGIETVNDKDCLLANFWRALQHDPDAVAFHADWPVNEADQHARHRWLVSQAEFRERMKTDPDFYDVKVAGWWVWGQCIWIGSGWCAAELSGDEERLPSFEGLPHLSDAGIGVNRQIPSLRNAGMGINRKIPSLRNAGMGINRKIPHLGDAGKGVNRLSRQIPHLGDGGHGLNRAGGQIPHLGNGGHGINRQAPGESGEALLGYMRALAARMRRVRVCCGEWDRILGPSPTTRLGVTGCFLDPPYSAEAGRTEVYAKEDLDVAHRVRRWAVAAGENPDMRIALCGYEGEHDAEIPETWERVWWKAHGGYGSLGNNAARLNSRRERIYFSPGCLKTTLF